MHDFKEIQERILIVEKNIQDKFPGCSYTTQVILWDDGTSRVGCRYGTNDTIHNFIHYNGELFYEEIMVTETVMTLDEFGVEHFWKLVEQ